MKCGAHGVTAIAQLSRERLADDPTLLRRLGLMLGRSPSAPTLHRVFKRIDVAAFEAAGEPQPQLHQLLPIQRGRIIQRTGRPSTEVIGGITSMTVNQADAT